MKHLEELSRRSLSRRAYYSKPMHVLQGLECQHGPEECRLNRIFACAIDLSKTPKDYWPFVECVESNYGARIEDSLDSCAEDNGFKLKDLEACASGDASFCWEPKAPGLGKVLSDAPDMHTRIGRACGATRRCLVMRF